MGSAQDLIWGKAPNEDPAVLLRMEEEAGVQILSMKKRDNASPKSWVTSLTTWTWLQKCHRHRPQASRKASFAHLGADLHPTCIQHPCFKSSRLLPVHLDDSFFFLQKAPGKARLLQLSRAPAGSLHVWLLMWKGKRLKISQTRLNRGQGGLC